MSHPLSVNASRVRQLLVGGLLAGMAVGIGAVSVSWFVAGRSAALVVACVVAVVVAFFALGQAVQLWCADQDPTVVLVVALLSYVARVVAIGFLVLGVLSQPGPWSDHRPWVLGASLATVAGWLAGEIWAYSRLRIPVFGETTSQ